MCLICLEFDIMSIIEIRRNLSEMKTSLGTHADEVSKRMRQREVEETSTELVAKWKATGLLDHLRGRSIEDLKRLQSMVPQGAGR